MKVVLELQDQPSNVRRITVRHDIVIGRGSDCNLRLSAPQVSRRHCFLRVGRDSVSVTDLDSSNGTFIDGTRISAGKRYDIANGAQLALGPIRFIIHVRSDVVIPDNAKSRMVPDFLQKETSHDSDEALGEDRSTVEGLKRSSDSKAPMNYAVEQGGESAEPHEPTADFRDDLSSISAAGDMFAPESDLADSRLEIVDFGRRLTEQSEDSDDSNAVPGYGAAAPSAGTDEEPQWETSISDSSDPPDGVDILSIADDSDVSSSFGDKLASDVGASAADDGGCVWLSDDENSDVMEVEEVLEVEEVADEFAEANDEVLEIAEEVLEAEEGSSWFIDDAEDADDLNTGLDAVENPERAEDTVQDDDIDPGLKNFLKGF